MKADRASIHADGQDLSFVTVMITDGQGLLVPRSNNRIQFEVSGPGEILGIDNGDATSLESFQSKDRKAFNGLCLVIIRGKAGAPGQIKLTAQSTGLTSSTILVNSK